MDYLSPEILPLDVLEPGGRTNPGAALDPRGWRTINLRIAKFGTKWRIVTQATCAPSVVVPELKGH
jgi:hypothetical protein